MNTENKTPITVEATINAPIEKVWKCWTSPEDIMKWCNASNDWHAPKAENDLRTGGTFLTRMEAKDGSFGFDFEGKYTNVVPLQIAGALARRICWYVKEGQPVKQAQEMGFIKFGSRVDVFVPLDATINVKIGEKTSGGQSIIANLK